MRQYLVKKEVYVSFYLGLISCFIVFVNVMKRGSNSRPKNCAK